MTISNGNIRTGFLLGAGAAVNVSVGFIPKKTEVWNVTDGTLITVGFHDKMIAFTSGGTAVPVAGSTTIKGVTSGATAKVREILLSSGSYAGGDAAGWFICDAEDVSGTFQSENVTFSGQPALEDDATVVVQVEQDVKIDTQANTVTGNNALLAYTGDATHAKGFTIGSSVATSGKVLRWVAYRG